MKAWLEIASPDPQYRGIVLMAENEEENQVLTNIWTNNGRAVAIGGGKKIVSLTIAPTPPEEKPDGAH